MDVILFENVPNLGPQGSFASVAPGYFRNYLSPKGLAVEATESNKKRLQDKLKRLEKLAEEEAKAARSEAERLEDLTLTFELKAGEDDKLFGSVTNSPPQNLQCAASESCPSIEQVGQAWVEKLCSLARVNSTVTMPVGTAMIP